MTFDVDEVLPATASSSDVGLIRDEGTARVPVGARSAGRRRLVGRYEHH
jgi:hypothetical protein